MSSSLYFQHSTLLPFVRNVYTFQLYLHCIPRYRSSRRSYFAAQSDIIFKVFKIEAISFFFTSRRENKFYHIEDRKESLSLVKFI